MAPVPEGLRVIDFGSVSALRSQTLWHAVAHGVAAGSPPTLSFVRSTHPYVSLGFHRRFDEIDADHCAERELPVFRRMVGGGPVYLDDRQLCFQLSIPVSMVPASRPQALRWWLEPVVDAFLAAGLPASLDPELEVVVEDRKVCGHGAAQVGDAVVMVGNLIERFDHRSAASVLSAPDPVDADEALRLMRRFVAWDHGGPEIDTPSFIDAATRGFSRLLDLVPRPGGLRSEEWRVVHEFDRRFTDDGWTRGVPGTPPAIWKVKVRAGVSLYSLRHDGAVVAASIVKGRLERLRVVDNELDDPAAMSNMSKAAC
ncbi:MAG: lipoate--protein ligase family protein, partial [Acidimicrobiales bacterium]